MAQQQHDPAQQWAGHLARLDGFRRDAVVAALRHSAETGWPASSEAVELLVSYALGEITARDYATGILRALGAETAEVAALDRAPAPTSSYVADDVEAAPVEEAPARAEASTDPAAPVISREDAVHAYVTGQIPVGEFLRIARG